jgi:translation initiation factor 4A
MNIINESVDEIVNENSIYDKNIKTWDELNLNTDILRGIYAYGFENPSPIQCKAILPILENKNVIAQAQSGTGKTGAFTISALSKLNLSNNTTQVLILTPTRELTIQITKVIHGISTMMNHINIKTLVGGSSVDRDIMDLKKNPPHIIVGCMGRVYDMLCRKALNYKHIKLLIVDEADEMLTSGFKLQLQSIFEYLNEDIQIALFSATMPSHMKSITDKFVTNPVNIVVKKEQLTLEGINQYYVALANDTDKYLTLKDLYASMSVSQCIIYCNSVRRVSDLYASMQDDGFPVCCIHSSMDKVSRENSLSEFTKGKYRVLISSNVTARGIDIQQVSIVINFDLPKCIHTYLHRIGRGGRWGRKGVGINFITRRDVDKMREIEQYYSTEINELPMNFMDNIA